LIALVFIIPDAQLLTGVGEGLLSLVILETPEHKPSPTNYDRSGLYYPRSAAEWDLSA